MRTEGKLVTCDYPNCSQQVLLKKLGTNDLDGGFTQVTEYEKTPEGWGNVMGKDLCPDHYQASQDTLHDFWNPIEPAHAAESEVPNYDMALKDEDILYTNTTDPSRMRVRVTGPTGTVEGSVEKDEDLPESQYDGEDW